MNKVPNKGSKPVTSRSRGTEGREIQKTPRRQPISRLDAKDSRLLKKEFLRLIRNRASIIRTLTDDDQTAIKLAESAASSQDEDFESDVERLIWKYVALQLKLQKKGTTSHEQSN